jgi:hypothetical protein
MGIVVVAGVFIMLRQSTTARFSVGPTVGWVLAGLALVQLAVVVGFLVPRMPLRPADQSPDQYWSTVARPDAIILWIMIDGAGLASWVGYLLSGAVVPAGVGVLAVAALILLRPDRFEGLTKQ